MKQNIRMFFTLILMSNNAWYSLIPSGKCSGWVLHHQTIKTVGIWKLSILFCDVFLEVSYMHSAACTAQCSSASYIPHQAYRLTAQLQAKNWAFMHALSWKGDMVISTAKLYFPRDLISIPGLSTYNYSLESCIVLFCCLCNEFHLKIKSDA